MFFMNKVYIFLIEFVYNCALLKNKLSNFKESENTFNCFFVISDKRVINNQQLLHK